MTNEMNKLVLGMIALAMIAGFLFGKGCQKTAYKSILRHDTVKTVQTIARPVFVKPEVLIKSILVPYKDTMLVKEQIPCDTSFIAQADSVITTTGDTVNVSFNHSKEKSYFSMVVKPRPDSILTKTIEIPAMQDKQTTDIGWIISAFAIGIGIGLLGGK